MSIDYCLDCGAYLAGAWTVHEPGCSLGEPLVKCECPPYLTEIFREMNRNRQKYDQP